MKVIELDGAVPSLMKLIKASRRQNVVFVKKGQPLAMLSQFNQEDLDDWRYEHSPEAIAIGKKAREQIRQGRYKTLEQIKAQYGNKK